MRLHALHPGAIQGKGSNFAIWQPWHQELDSIESTKGRVQLEQERAQTEVQLAQSEVRKWQDKYDMVSKELKQKESALHRVEVELDRTRNDLERTKQNAEKAGLSAKMYEDKIAASNREIEGWKEKQMRTHAEVTEVQLRFDQG